MQYNPRKYKILIKIVSIALIEAIIASDISFALPDAGKYNLAAPLAAKPPCSVQHNPDGSLVVKPPSHEIKKEWLRKGMENIVNQALIMQLSKSTLARRLKQFLKKQDYEKFTDDRYFTQYITEERVDGIIIAFNVWVIQDGRYEWRRFTLRDAKIIDDIKPTHAAPVLEPLPAAAPEAEDPRANEPAQTKGLAFRTAAALSVYAGGLAIVAAAYCAGYLDWYILIKNTSRMLPWNYGLEAWIYWPCARLDIITGIFTWFTCDILGQFINQGKHIRLKQSIFVGGVGGVLQGIGTHVLYNSVEFLPVAPWGLGQKIIRAVYTLAGGLALVKVFTGFTSYARKRLRVEGATDEDEKYRGRDVLYLKFILAPPKTFLIVNFFPPAIRVISEQLWEYGMKILDAYLMNRAKPLFAHKLQRWLKKVMNIMAFDISGPHAWIGMPQVRLFKLFFGGALGVPAVPNKEFESGDQDLGRILELSPAEFVRREGKKLMDDMDAPLQILKVKFMSGMVFEKLARGKKLSDKSRNIIDGIMEQIEVLTKYVDDARTGICVLQAKAIDTDRNLARVLKVLQNTSAKLLNGPLLSLHVLCQRCLRENTELTELEIRDMKRKIALIDNVIRSLAGTEKVLLDKTGEFMYLSEIGVDVRNYPNEVSEWERVEEYPKVYKLLRAIWNKAGYLPVTALSIMRMIYTPMVGSISIIIRDNPKRYKEFVHIKNDPDSPLWIVTDGSATLGLENTGALAAGPVMEGKQSLFKWFGDVKANILLVDTSRERAEGSVSGEIKQRNIVNKITHAVENLKKQYGNVMVMLEDIAAPECFAVEKNLNKAGITAIHDDQHGTAIVIAAGVLNALKIAGKKEKDAKIVISGAGASGTATAVLLNKFGIGDIICLDSQGPIYTERGPLTEEKTILAGFNKSGYKGLGRSGRRTDEEMIQELKGALKDADGFIGLAKPALYRGHEDVLSEMKDKSFVFACSNPDPEFDIKKIKTSKEQGGFANIMVLGCGRYGIAGVSTLNNCYVFPGLYRALVDLFNEGKCDSGLKQDEMLELSKAAALALAGLASEETLARNIVLPPTFKDEDYNLIITETVAGAVARYFWAHGKYTHLAEDMAAEHNKLIAGLSDKDRGILNARYDFGSQDDSTPAAVVDTPEYPQSPFSPRTPGPKIDNYPDPDHRRQEKIEQSQKNKFSPKKTSLKYPHLGRPTVYKESALFSDDERRQMRERGDILRKIYPRLTAEEKQIFLRPDFLPVLLGAKSAFLLYGEIDIEYFMMFILKLINMPEFRELIMHGVVYYRPNYLISMPDFIRRINDERAGQYLVDNNILKPEELQTLISQGERLDGADVVNVMDKMAELVSRYSRYLEPDTPGMTEFEGFLLGYPVEDIEYGRDSIESSARPVIVRNDYGSIIISKDNPKSKYILARWEFAATYGYSLFEHENDFSEVMPEEALAAYNEVKNKTEIEILNIDMQNIHSLTGQKGGSLKAAVTLPEYPQSPLPPRTFGPTIRKSPDPDMGEFGDAQGRENTADKYSPNKTQSEVLFQDNFKLVQRRPETRISFIVFGTDWIEGYNERGNRRRDALNPLISRLRIYCGNNNVEFFDGSDEEVTKKVNDIKTADPNARGIVIAGEDAAANIEGLLKTFNRVNDEDVLLAAVKNNKIGQDSFIRLMDMLAVTLEILQSETIDEESIRSRYPSLGFKAVSSRRVTFEPDARPMPIEEMRDAYQHAACYFA